MKILYSLLTIAFFSVYTNAQTFESKSGLISDNNTENLFDINVVGIKNTSNNFGFESVTIDIDHSWNSDLDIALIAPDGTRVTLVKGNGGSSQNYKNTIFTMSAINSIATADAPFTGEYIPQDNLGIFNNAKNLNGKWQLAITDTYVGNAGKLNKFSITFGSAPSAKLIFAPAPPCPAGSVPAGFQCSNATPICDLSSYCGNTSSQYAPTHTWPALTNAFCGSIDNNSFIKFTASATTASFNVWVANSRNRAGIQMMVYSTTNCGSGAVTNFGCASQINPTTPGGFNGNPTVFVAGGPGATGGTSTTPYLTIGDTYWLMFDGFGGDVCDYRVSSSTGVSIVRISPSSASVCAPGTPVTLTASGSSNYVWSPATGLNTTTGPVVIASPLLTTIYTVTASNVCTPKTVTVTVGTFNINATPPDLQFCNQPATPVYNLNDNNSTILGPLDPNNYDIFFYTSMPNAISGIGQIPNATTYSPAGLNQTIYVSITEISGGGCVKYASFQLKICSPPCPTVSNSGPICANGTFNLFANNIPAGTNYVWSGPNGFTSNQQNPTNIPAPTGTAPFIYTLTCTGAVTCAPTTTLIVNLVPNAGSAGTTTIQQTDLNPINLFSLLSGSPQPGGLWVRTTGINGTLNPITGIFTPTATTSASSTFTYTITTLSCGTSSSIVTVIRNIIPPSLIINNPSPIVECDDNLVTDGIACTFNLHSRDTQITANPALIINYFITETDAQINATINIIGGSQFAPTTYCNNKPGNQRVYVRVEDPNDATKFAITVLDLIVAPRPLKNLLLKPYELCNNSFPAANENFNLHTKDVDIINGQVASNLVEVNYYLTEIDAQNDLPSTRLPNIYSSNTKTIWYNIHFLSTNCGTVGELDLIVNPLPAIISPAYNAYRLCESSPVYDGYEVFQLESQIRYILNNNLGVEVSFFESYTGALANTGRINNLNYTNTQPFSQTIGIRLTNRITGCFSTSTMDLIVNPLPAPVPPTTPYTVCDTDQNGNYFIDLTIKIPSILQGALDTTIQFFGTSDDAENGYLVNQLSNPYNLLMPTQTVFVRATNTLTGCYRILPIIIEVKPAPILPLATPLADLIICDEDNPGNNQNATTTVDLTIQNQFLLAVQTLPASNFTITYYLTQADAEASPTGLSPIIYPANFIGTNNQEIWVRIENNITKCFQSTSFALKVNIPLALTTPSDLNVCDDGPIPVSTYPKTIFDLTVKNSAILAGAVTPANYTVTYYNTEAGSLANNAADKIVIPTAYSNLTNPQTLGVIVTSQDGCRSYTTLTINVLPIPSPNVNPPDLPAQCDDNIVLAPNNPVGFEYFNLTTNANYIRNSDSTVILRYFPTKADAEAEPPTNEIKLPTSDPANALVSGDVYIRVESTIYTSSIPAQCYKLVIQKLKVNPLPTVSALDASINPGNQVQICQNFTTMPVVLDTFNLTALIPQLLLNNPIVVPATVPPTYTNTYTTTFYTLANDAKAGSNSITNPSTYQAITAVGTPQTIYVRVVNDQTGCVNATGLFTIVVNPKPTVTIPTNPLNTCDTDGINNGKFLYPLDVLETNILGPTQPKTDFTVTFYDNYLDATTSQNAIADKSNYYGYTHDLWIRVENNVTHCFELAKSPQIVELIPEPLITTVNSINTTCFDFITDYPDRNLVLTAQNLIPVQGLTPNTYQWFEGYSPTTLVAIPGATSSTFDVNQAANPKGANRYYTVEEKSASALACAVTSPVFEVKQSGKAVNQPGTIGYYITNAFNDNQIITVTITGYGTYQYQLDNGVFQDSPVFEYVSIVGPHYITVRDITGGVNFSCDDYQILDVQTIDYPHYFTPNGDGTNDKWNIVGLSSANDVKIYIFDRDGKLLKQISPKGEGWDGNFNGNPYPATDYWFTVDYIEQGSSKQYKSHFSLKR